jgi:CubicO group peptidase (beta-lactamase class C family)
MKKTYLFILLAFSSITLLSQDDKKDYSEAFKLIEVWLDAQQDFEQLPGISAIVVEDQEVMWTGAFGFANPETKVASEPATLYSICSISKLLTSVAIMKLYDEGKLRLDDNVADLLPWYNLKQDYPASGPITVETLMTHSSGLPREADYPYWTGPDFPFPTDEEVKAKLGDQETLYPASTYFQYSNLALTLLGEIVVEVSGQPFDEYITENILVPLELNNTRPELPEDFYGNQLAVGYSAITRDNGREKVNFFQANGITPAAGFSSNVEDLGKFASWQFRLMDTTLTEVIKPSTLKNMHRVHWTDPDWKITWGLGFSVRKDKAGNTVIGHGGSCPGYRSGFSMYPKDKRAFVVMINASGTSPGKYIGGMVAILKKVKPADDKEETTKDFTEYTGYYTLQPWWGEAYVSTSNGKLVVMGLPTNDPGEALSFYKHIEGDTFKRIRDDDELGETLTFNRNENGQVVSYTRHGNSMERLER